MLIRFIGWLSLDSDGDDEGENTAKKSETINFVVMLKKNNKPQVIILAIGFVKICN